MNISSQFYRPACFLFFLYCDKADRKYILCRPGRVISINRSRIYKLANHTEKNILKQRL